MAERYDLLADILPTFKITKPIRLIELFAGYGSQALALKYLGADFEHWKIAEWNYKSFEAYHQIHMPEDTTDYSAGLNKEQLAEYLLGKGISSDWNKAMTREQVAKLKENELRKIYNSIITTHNLVDISEVNAEDLQIIEQDKYCYIMTYSFPCQDLSRAGLRKGMHKDGNTRSGLLWEVERLLKECKQIGCLPDLLLMENVPQVHGKGNEENFKKWVHELIKIGYENYYDELIATDFGIPQIRDRTFMASVRNAYYDFPKPIKLDKRLKDLLEPIVEDKYYLSKKAINGLQIDKIPNKKLDNQSTCYAEIKRAHGYFPGSISDTDVLSTIDACIDRQHLVIAEKLKIKNATQKGYLEGEDGDGVDISGRMEYHRGTVQKGLSQTLSTYGGECQGVIEDLRIRKLTPRECFRLMGVKDEDSEKLHMSNSIKYHIAGDSIVTTVLMAIFGEMLEIDWEQKVREVTEYGRN